MRLKVQPLYESGGNNSPMTLIEHPNGLVTIELWHPARSITFTKEEWSKVHILFSEK